jgi:type I restriction enzyme M protein
MHFTLKTSSLQRTDLDEFVKNYNPENRHQRKATWKDSPSPQPHKDSPSPSLPLPSRERIRGEGALSSGEEVNSEGRWRSYTYDELISRDKASLDIFWLKDESLEASYNLPDPDVIAQEIVEDLEAALEQFREIVGDLGGEEAKG